MKRKVLLAATVVKQHILTFHLPVLKWFQEQGWETHVAAENDFDDPEECVIPYCDYFHQIPFSRSPFHPNNLKAYREIKKLVKQEQFDLVHTNTPSASVLVRLVCQSERKNGTKVIYTAHGFHFYKKGSALPRKGILWKNIPRESVPRNSILWNTVPWKNWILYYPIEKFCARFTDVLITINQEDYRLAKRHFHAGRVVYVPGVGVDVEEIAKRADTVDRNEKRRELGIPEEAVVLVSVGELSENKNHIMVLDTLEKLYRVKQSLEGERSSERHLYYLICGQGAFRETLRKRAEEIGLTENVRLLGYRKDVIEILAASDIFVFPSKREGLPMALMEAMAVGIPCIASDIRGNRELLKGKSEDNRYLFRLERPEELVRKLGRMIEQIEKRKQTGEQRKQEQEEQRKKKSRERVQPYSKEVVMKKMMGIYKELVRKEKPKKKNRRNRRN